MKVLIVGGGIAGFVLQHQLAGLGIEAHIYERVKRFEHVGGGLILKSPATRSLDQSGLLEKVQERGVPLRRHELFDQHGAALGAIDFEAMYAQGLTPGVFIHRAAFHQVLEEAVAEERVHRGSRVRSVELREDGVTLDVEGLGAVHGDVVVGADGVHSQIREQLFGFHEHPLHFRSYRWCVPNAVGCEHFMEFMGEGMSLGMLPVAREELFLWLSVPTPAGSPSQATETTAFKAYMGQFRHPMVLAALEHLRDASTVLSTDIHEVTMEEYYQGRCVLIGDAAHAMSPSMGTGSAMAMGDAVVLAQELGRVAAGEQDLDEALFSFYLHRMPRIEAMRALTRAVDAEHHATSPSIVRRRNLKLAAWLQDVPRLRRELAGSLGGDL